jgi:hypothetical protein
MDRAIAFLKSSAADRGLDQAQLAEEWRAANDRVRELAEREGGIADDPPIPELPKELEPLARKVYQDPIFASAYRNIPCRIAMVELDRLVVHQRCMDLDFASGIRSGLGPHPSGGDIFKTCLPYDHPVPPVKAERTGKGSFTFSSPSTDLRFLDVLVLDGDRVRGYSPPGPVASVLGLVVGFGSNFLNAVHIENRLILNNGSHRAFALREIGISSVPCVVQEARGREELVSLISRDVRDRADELLTDPRPPLLKDYFEPALARRVKLKSKARRVRVSFAVEEETVPVEQGISPKLPIGSKE